MKPRLPHIAWNAVTAALAAASMLACATSSMAAAPTLGGVTQISAGGGHACVVTTAGTVRCWGENEYGSVGDGTRAARRSPVDVVGLAGSAAVSAGEYHTCALTFAGGLKCWGRNDHGQLGDGTNATRLAPVDVQGLPAGVVAVSAGESHTCALMSSGGVKCWGDNGYGQLGDGSTIERWAPVDVAGLGSPITAIATSGPFSCAMTSSGAVLCWGGNLTGLLGDGTTDARTSPVTVSGLSSGATSIATRYSHSCAVTAGGGVKCWGFNGIGQLGDGTNDPRLGSVVVTGLSGATQVGTGGSHTCALVTSGGVRCWGSNGHGMLGTGNSLDSYSPVDVVGLPGPMQSISVGAGFSCALSPSGEPWCWGSNHLAQLGIGSWDFSAHSTPAQVTDLFVLPRLANLSTRGEVLNGNDVMIGGFIIGGFATKTVVVRARGPSLVPFGIANALANPTLRVVRSSDGAHVGTIDDWGTDLANAYAVAASGFAPSHASEAALRLQLPPGAYTAIVSGVGGGTGVGIVEVFEVDHPEVPLVNISTRGQVLTGNDVMIGGFVIQGASPQTVVVRARGPSLAPFGITNPLANPMLQLVRSSDQSLVAANDDWGTAANAAAISASGFAPANSLEAAILITLDPGAYTAIVSGVGGGTGVGIVEVFTQ